MIRVRDNNLKISLFLRELYLIHTRYAQLHRNVRARSILPCGYAQVAQSQTTIYAYQCHIFESWRVTQFALVNYRESSERHGTRSITSPSLEIEYPT